MTRAPYYVRRIETGGEYTREYVRRFVSWAVVERATGEILFYRQTREDARWWARRIEATERDTARARRRAARALKSCPRP